MIHNTRISAIAIISKNRGLGKDNKLLFHVPGELPRFKRITMGHPIIMGRKTYESIGKPLPGRLNIVITRDPNYKVDGIVVVNSLKKAIDRTKKSEEKRTHSVIASVAKQSNITEEIAADSLSPRNDDESELFILGGGQIFKEAMPEIDRLYLTIVDKEVDADVFFPDYSEFGKVIDKEERHDWDYPYTFLTLERNS